MDYTNINKCYSTDFLDLYHCDCMELLKQTPDNYYCLSICDPPYGIGMGGCLNVNSKVKFIDKVWDKSIPSDNYFTEIKRISKNQIVWGANYFPFLWKEACKEFIFWNKLNHHDNRSDGEMAWTSFNGLAKYFEYMWDGNRYGFKGNIQGTGKPTIRIHPTEKPVALYAWILKNYAQPNDRILDTHLGSASISLAVHKANALDKMNLHLTACEIDREYIDKAVKRISDSIKQGTLDF